MIPKLIALKTQYHFYAEIIEFILLFFLLLLILHYINKLIKLPRLIIFIITVDMFLIFPKFTINILTFIIKFVFYSAFKFIQLIIKLLKFSRLEIIIFINLLLIGILLYKFYWKKRKKISQNDQLKDKNHQQA